MFFFPKNLHTLTVLGIYQSGLLAGQNAFNRRPTKGWISKNQQDLILQKIRGHFFISASIFKIKVSMERSHQCGFMTIILLKIDGAVHEILMKNMWPLGHMWSS